MWPSLIEEKSFAQSLRNAGVRLIAKLGICTQYRINIETEGFLVDLEGNLEQYRGESTITSSLSVYAKVLVDNLNGIKISAFLID